MFDTEAQRAVLNAYDALIASIPLCLTGLRAYYVSQREQYAKACDVE